MTQPCILTQARDGVGLVTLDRPKVLNALNRQLIAELARALAAFDEDDSIGAMVITGNEKAFAAGADIAEMAGKSSMDMYLSNHFAGWDVITSRRKPLIAAVAGFALGGGCELAMACDLIIAAENARFGQPEIKLGVLPGLGGTQRLTRAVGKAKAMDLCLTGRMMDAEEAERSGLVCRVVPAAKLLDEALATGRAIAAMSAPAVSMVKEAVNRAFETTLAEGVHFEKRLFQASFATEDQAEGMQAFLDKRDAQWKHR